MHNKRESTGELARALPGLDYQLQEIMLVAKLWNSTGPECIRCTLLSVLWFSGKQVRQKACKKRFANATDRRLPVPRV